jgi:hypothetical protein
VTFINDIFRKCCNDLKVECLICGAKRRCTLNYTRVWTRVFSVVNGDEYHWLYGGFEVQGAIFCVFKVKI